MRQQENDWKSKQNCPEQEEWAQTGQTKEQCWKCSCSAALLPKGSQHVLKGICKGGLCFQGSYEPLHDLKWEKPKLSTSAFDFQHVSTPELHLRASHTSPGWGGRPKGAPHCPTTNTNAQGPKAAHCTDFHSLSPSGWFAFLEARKVLLKKENMVSKTTDKFTFFAATSLLLGYNQTTCWAHFKHYFFILRVFF